MPQPRAEAPESNENVRLRAQLASVKLLIIDELGYRTIAQRIGIDGVYIYVKALFDKLLAAQEKMSTAILDLLGKPPKRRYICGDTTQRPLRTACPIDEA